MGRTCRYVFVGTIFLSSCMRVEGPSPPSTSASVEREDPQEVTSLAEGSAAAAPASPVSGEPSTTAPIGELAASQQRAFARDDADRVQRASATDLRATLDDRVVSIVRTFYQSAKAEGVQFARAAVEGTSTDSTGALTSTLMASSDGGEFAIYRNCVWSTRCSLVPRVRIEPWGSVSAQLYFDDVNEENGPCREGVITLACRCRITYFELNFTVGCRDLLTDAGYRRAERYVEAGLRRRVAEVVEEESLRRSELH